MKTRIRVDEVGPGMFSSERFVQLEVAGKNYALFVDQSSVQDHTMEVQVILMDEESALVQLPRDTLNAGSRLRVPRSSLVNA
jgi:hypothetical protein